MAGTSERRVYGTDGELCYRVVTVAGPFCENRTETWTDGNGDPVATLSVPFMQSQSFSCASGEASICPLGIPCAWDFPATPTCEAGTCPALP